MFSFWILSCLALMVSAKPGQYYAAQQQQSHHAHQFTSQQTEFLPTAPAFVQHHEQQQPQLPVAYSTIGTPLESHAHVHEHAHVHPHHQAVFQNYVPSHAAPSAAAYQGFLPSAAPTIATTYNGLTGFSGVQPQFVAHEPTAFAQDAAQNTGFTHQNFFGNVGVQHQAFQAPEPTFTPAFAPQPTYANVLATDSSVLSQEPTFESYEGPHSSIAPTAFSAELGQSAAPVETVPHLPELSPTLPTLPAHEVLHHALPVHEPLQHSFPLPQFLAQAPLQQLPAHEPRLLLPEQPKQLEPIQTTTIHKSVRLTSHFPFNSTFLTFFFFNFVNSLDLCACSTTRIRRTRNRTIASATSC